MKSGMIFGPDGDRMLRSGGTTFTQEGAYRKSGQTTFGPAGVSMLRSGPVTFLSDGNRILKSGNTWYGPKGRYMLTGRTLFGPDGQTWHGMTADDVELIIARDT